MYYLSPDNSLVKQVLNFVNLTNINKARFKFMFDFYVYDYYSTGSKRTMIYIN